MTELANNNLAGRTALIIGGSRGIGRVTVERFAADGARVVFTYAASAHAAEDLAGQVTAKGGDAKAIKADMGSPSEIRHGFNRAEQELGGLDIVIVNGATASAAPISEVTEEEFDRVFGINVKGTFVAFQEAARRVRRGGRIMATSSGGTQMRVPDISLYLGSKGAIEQFVRVLARELGDREITVNAVSPGFTDTEMLPDQYRAVAAQASPFQRVGTPEDIADIFALLASERGRWITGQNVHAGGGAF